MKVKRDSKALNRIIERFSSEWQEQASKAIDRLYQFLQNGQKVDAAVSKLAKEYPSLFTLPNLQDALVEAAAYGYGIVPEVLSEATANDWRTRLADKWDASGMKLSEKLHGASQAMRNNIINTIQEQMRKNRSWTDMAKSLYEGYGDDSDVLRKQDIPAYLQAVRRATGGDKKAVRAQEKALNNIARMAKRGAPNKALKSSYTEFLDSVQNGTEEQIAKACRVAMEEKARYVAERIARTEMARAWSDGFWSQVQADNDVVAVQFKLSTRHPLFDICDMFAKADMFGLGAGIFPKNKIPAIPVHPHCLCRYVELYEGEADMAKKREQVKKAGDKWLKSLPEVRRMQVLGVRGMAEWENGENWQGIIHGWAGLREANTRLKNTKGVLSELEKKGIIEVEKTTLDGPPNGITQKTNKFGGIDRNYYDSNGRQYKQISNNDHNHPKYKGFGKHGEHAHDYVYDKDGNLIDRPARELTKEERHFNGDIL